MAKIVDITDKLEFEANPILKIGTLDVEVKSDAKTMLKLMGVFSKGEDLEAVEEALELIFAPGDVEAICELNRNGKKLSAKSLTTIVQAAMELVMGESDQGE